MIGTWAGLRPLVADAKSTRTADLSRRHSVTTSPAGVITVTGGKLTTYRAMAEDTVDVAVKTARHAADGCKTKRLKLLDDRRPRSTRSSRADTSSRRAARARPRIPARPTRCTRPATRWCYSLTDVLARRTRALLLDRDATVAAAAPPWRSWSRPTWAGRPADVDAQVQLLRGGRSRAQSERAPTPPIEFSTDAASTASRFSAAAVDVPDAVLGRLRDACASVSVDARRHRRGGPRLVAARHALGAGRARPRRGRCAVHARRPPRKSRRCCACATTPASRSRPWPVAAACAAARSRCSVASASTSRDWSGIVDVDDSSLLVTARAGTFGDVFEDDLRAAYGLTVGHWPQSIALSTDRWLGRVPRRRPVLDALRQDRRHRARPRSRAGRRHRRAHRRPRAAPSRRSRPQPVVRRQRRHARCDHRSAVPRPPGPDRRRPRRLRLRRRSPPGSKRAGSILRADANPAVLRLYDAREMPSPLRHAAGPVRAARARRGRRSARRRQPRRRRGRCGARRRGAVRTRTCWTTGSRRATTSPVSRRRCAAASSSTRPRSPGAGATCRRSTTPSSRRWRPCPAPSPCTSHQSHAYTDGACLYFTWAGTPPGRRRRGVVQRTAWDTVTEHRARARRRAVASPRRRAQPRPLPRRRAGSAGATTCCGSVKTRARPQRHLEPRQVLPGHAVGPRALGVSRRERSSTSSRSGAARSAC